VTDVRATVSGSFHRYMPQVKEAVDQLIDAGVQVLSPADPRVVDYAGEFLFVASDDVRSIKLVQQRHMECIESSHFLWLVCPDGYVGTSAVLEMGWACHARIPICTLHAPYDVTLKELVHVVGSIPEAIEIGLRTQPRNLKSSLFIDPHGAIEEMHDELDRLAPLLQGRRKLPSAEVERGVERMRGRLKRGLGVS
jgi:hypothetical protein